MGTGGCTNCGSDHAVKISGKDFCANCGLPMVRAEAAAAAAPPPPAPTTATAPVQAPAPVPAPAPTPSPAPVAPAVPQTPVPTPAPAPQTPVKPALDLRMPPTATAKPGGQVIDLRTNQPKRPTIAAVANNQMSSQRIDLVAPAARKQQRTELAQQTAQHASVSKFTPKPEPAAPPTPTPAMVPTAAAAPVAAAAKTPGILPNAAAGMHQAMQKLIPKLPDAEIAPSAIPTQTKAPLGKTGLAIAAVAIAALGSYTWYTNYPKMAVQLAGSRAGVRASFPSFVPSSYRLSGAVAYGVGEVSYKLKSPASNSELKITQRQTNWDSRSLLENFVKSKTANPLSVGSQGLTVYIYGGQATWVNHGIWYTLDGTDELNREQILKIAYSL